MTERVLFLCSHNSARSQMAEGMLRAWAGERYEAHSAGTVATFVWPEAIQVMSDLGIDISGHESKPISRFEGEDFDYAVTVCEDSTEACPYFPARQVLHWSFEDPSAVVGGDEDRLAVFRRVRGEIASQVRAEFGPGKT